MSNTVIETFQVLHHELLYTGIRDDSYRTDTGSNELYQYLSLISLGVCLCYNLPSILCIALNQRGDFLLLYRVLLAVWHTLTVPPHTEIKCIISTECNDRIIYYLDMESEVGELTDFRFHI